MVQYSQCLINKSRCILYLLCAIIACGCCVFLESNVDSTQSNAYLEAQNELNDKIKSKSYSKALRPFPALGHESSNFVNSTVVNVSIFILKIDRVDDERMEATLQVYFRQTWKDPRLRYQADSDVINYIALDHEVGEQIWNPDLFISNEASPSFVHSVLTKNSFKRVSPDGSVWWSVRLTTTLSCPMDFRYFPFDEQICNITVESYAYSRNDLIIRWIMEDDAVGLTKIPKYKRFQTKFDVVDHKFGSCMKTMKGMDYTCIYLALFFQRQSSHYLINFYIPAAMCVILSWISFWMGESTSARLSLTLTLLLTMTTQSQASYSTLPQTSYTKAIDVYTGCCGFFCVLAILETAIIGYMIQSSQMEDVQKIGSQSWVVAALGQPQGSKKIPSLQVAEQTRHLKRRRAMILDKIARFAFPFSFLVFNIFYVVCVGIGRHYPEPEN